MKRVLLILGMLGLTAVSWFVVAQATIQYPMEYKQHLKKAQDYEELEIYLDALSEYETALAYDTENLEIQKKIIDMNYCLGKFSAFEELALKYYGAHTDDYDMLETIIDYYKETGRRADARNLLQEQLTQFPDNETLLAIYDEFDGEYSRVDVQYHYISTFFMGYAMVEQDGKYGLINESGSTVVGVAYDKVSLLSDGYIPVQVGEEDYYIDSDGYKRLDSKESFSELGFFSQGIATAHLDGKALYINSEYTTCTPRWDETYAMYNDRAAVVVDGAWGIINRSFENVTECVYEDVARNDFGVCSINNAIFVKENGLYGMMDLDGKWIIEPTFEEVRAFERSNQFAAVKKDGAWGFVDSAGNVVIDYQYEDAKSFAMGYGAVKKDGAWGYIDTENEMVVEPTFEDAGIINSKKIAAVQMSGVWQLIQMEFIY